MSDNPGAYPFDPESETGQFRVLIGDTSSVPYDPPVSGVQNYGMFSDDEISVFLTQAGSVFGAVSLAYFQMAGAAALEAKSVRDFDLQIDLTKRSAELRAMASEWQKRADGEVAEFFELFPVVDQGSSCGCVHVEAMGQCLCATRRL